MQSSRIALIAAAAGVLLGGTLSAGQLGSVENRLYRHVKTDVAFPIPAGWTVLTTGGSSDGGEQMYMRHDTSPRTYVAVWMKQETNTPAEAVALLESEVQRKLKQRGGDITGYRFRPDSIEHVDIAGHKAVRAVADLTHSGQVEYFTWIFTERTRVQFDVRGVEPDASTITSRLGTIVQAAQIP
jgi:hypothetical protein